MSCARSKFSLVGLKETTVMLTGENRFQIVLVPVTLVLAEIHPLHFTL